mmetsp:Transcript_4546/g.7754  ORF Transcript_4546/g.7754 Transcript_4546/m.7754 type:complete len:255 (-) Transcript_4546:221-985(-)
MQTARQQLSPHCSDWTEAGQKLGRSWTNRCGCPFAVAYTRCGLPLPRGLPLKGRAVSLLAVLPPRAKGRTSSSTTGRAKTAPTISCTVTGSAKGAMEGWEDRPWVTRRFSSAFRAAAWRRSGWAHAASTTCAFHRPAAFCCACDICSLTAGGVWCCNWARPMDTTEEKADRIDLVVQANASCSLSNFPEDISWATALISSMPRVAPACTLLLRAAMSFPKSICEALPASVSFEWHCVRDDSFSDRTALDLLMAF